MRKFFILALVCTVIALSSVLLSSCAKEVDYTKYVSERRSNIYLYSDDERSVTLNCTEREQPYAADGYRGDMCSLIEILVSFSHNPESVALGVGEYSGEMNYESVENRYFLSFSAEAFESETVEVTLTCGGESNTYTCLGARTAGVMSCDDAVKCVIEYDRALFDGMTKNGVFAGEIFVRLLYDDGCYYYVGICGKDKKISAYLLDGERGKIIATKQLQG